jgi:hypothetical protein
MRLVGGLFVVAFFSSALCIVASETPPAQIGTPRGVVYLGEGTDWRIGTCQPV